MALPDKRAVLQHLTKARLRELADAFELKIAAAEAKDAHVEILARSKRASHEKVLQALTDDELRGLCDGHRLDPAGRDHGALVDLLLGRAAPAPPAASPTAPPVSSTPAPPPERVFAGSDTRDLEPGAIVRVRSRQYLVGDVARPARPGQATLVRLSCLEDDAQGDPLEVLWEHEIDARILGRSTWEQVAKRGFDRPDLFSAYLHTLRWHCVTATDPKLFQAPYRAGIEVKAYQLEPLRKALAMPRVRLFIADDVGLGKTIEAGLILREMLMRQRVRRVVVACPPSVVRQWRDEMEQRFGLTFVILDRDYVAECRRERGYGVNPWTTHTRFILSHALLRDEAYAASLRDWLGPFASQTLLILDEAHNAAPASGSRYAVDSRFTKAVREVAGRFEHRLFLSATPHNGHSNSFSALLEILDPDRFCRGVPVDDPKILDAVMVRRLKRDLADIAPGDFPTRHVIPEIIENLPDDAPELRLSQLLQRYRQLREERLEAAPKGQRAAGMLIVTTLQKRLLSSIAAFARTLSIHRRAVEKASAQVVAADSPTDLLTAGPSSDDERAELPEDDVAREEEAQLELVTRRAPPASAEELDLLRQMSQLAAASEHVPDSRVRRLIAWVRDNLCPQLGTPGAAWLPRRVLVFTEYADTKRYLLDRLGEALASSDQADARIRAFHGGMGDEAREIIKSAFNADPARHPLRILIATDAAREGVNLQNHCSDLFHFDIPWNPSRMEQRNGRIDRKLQRASDVYCRYFVLPQRAEDRVLDVLVQKTATIHRELGSLSPVVERDVEALLRQGIAHPEAPDLVDRLKAIEPQRPTLRDLQIQRELEQVRARQQSLKTQVAGLQELLKTSQQWLGLDSEAFHQALSAALQLLGAEPLQPVADAAAAADRERAAWRFPDLHRRAGADPTWGATLDALRPPRGHDQKLHEWRRDSPIRPVVFRDPGNLDGAVVHLHLEHRVVQRLLGRFLSQGFLHDELSRACVCRTDDPRPKILALGRLSLYGAGAARLHDEIIAVAAEWVEPDLRGKKKLAPLTEADKKDVVAELEHALATPRLREVPAAVGRRLQGFAARDVDELLPHLQRRARDVVASAEKLLHRRGEQEAAELGRVLRAQIDRIKARIAELDAGQVALDFGDEHERRQLEADRRFWDRRLPQLHDELATAPAKIAAGYKVEAVRVEPAGLVYLWPVSA